MGIRCHCEGNTTADCVKIFSIALSITAWTFGHIAGIDHYKIDPLEGTEDSVEVNPISKQ